VADDGDTRALVQSEWSGATAGGCIENPTWHKNPRFKLTIPAEKDVMVREGD